MGLLDSIDPQILALLQGPSADDEAQRRKHALLTAGLGMMQNSYMNPVRAIGYGGLLGQQAYNDEATTQSRQAAQRLAGFGQAMNLQNQLQTYQDQAGLRKAETEFSSRFGIPGAPQQAAPPGSPQGPMDAPGVAAASMPQAGGMLAPTAQGPQAPQQQTLRGVPNKRAMAQKYQDMGDYWMQNSSGNPQILVKAQQYYDLAQKTMPKVKEVMNAVDPTSGQRVKVNVYEDGTREILPDIAPDKEKAVEVKTGTKVFAADPYNLKPIAGGGSYNMEMTPGEKASNAVAWANNKETVRRNNIMEGDPQQIEATAQLIANGKMPPPSGFAAARPIAQSIMARVAQINPEYSAIDFNTAKKAEADFATGKTGNQVRSFNVGLAHLDTLGQLADALHNGDLQLVNKIGNVVSQQTGAPSVTNFNAAKAVVGNEIVKAIVGAGGGVGDREKAQADLAAANSPAQLKGVIETYKTLMGGQLAGLQRQYQTNTKRNDFERMLSPEARKYVHAGTAGDSQIDDLVKKYTQ